MTNIRYPIFLPIALCGPLLGAFNSPLSEASCRMWADQVVKTISQGDSDFLAASFNVEAMAKRYLSGLPGRTARVEDLPFSHTVHRIADLTTKVVREGGSIRLVTIRGTSDQRRALFRVTTKGGFTYSEFLLEAAPKGGIAVVDMYSFQTGEWVTSASSDKSVFQTFKNSQEELGQSAAALTRATDALEKGNRSTALEELDRLPEPIQHQKLVLLIRLRCLDPGKQLKKYQDVLDDLVKHYPQDHSIYLQGFTYAMAAHDFARALKYLGVLEASTDGDPYLKYMEALILFKTRSVTEASLKIGEAIALEPDNINYYFEKLKIDLDLCKFDEVAASLTILEGRFGYPMTGLETRPALNKFILSPEYKKWKENRGLKTKL